jgi:hypothetical protein
MAPPPHTRLGHGRPPRKPAAVCRPRRTRAPRLTAAPFWQDPTPPPAPLASRAQAKMRELRPAELGASAGLLVGQAVYGVGEAARRTLPCPGPYREDVFGWKSLDGSI